QKNDHEEADHAGLVALEAPPGEAGGAFDDLADFVGSADGRFGGIEGQDGFEGVGHFRNSGVADARVEPGEENLGHKIAQDQKHAADQEQGHDQELIFGAQGFEEQLSHAGIIQDNFQEGRAAEEGGEFEAKERDQGIDGVAQGVLVNHLPLAEPFGAGGGDVLEAEGFQQI